MHLLNRNVSRISSYCMVVLTCSPESPLPAWYNTVYILKHLPVFKWHSIDFGWESRLRTVNSVHQRCYFTCLNGESQVWHRTEGLKLVVRQCKLIEGWEGCVKGLVQVRCVLHKFWIYAFISALGKNFVMGQNSLWVGCCKKKN